MSVKLDYKDTVKKENLLLVVAADARAKETVNT
jgi:hypothetical protein